MISNLGITWEDTIYNIFWLTLIPISMEIAFLWHKYVHGLLWNFQLLCVKLNLKKKPSTNRPFFKYALRCSGGRLNLKKTHWKDYRCNNPGISLKPLQLKSVMFLGCFCLKSNTGRDCKSFSPPPLWRQRFMYVKRLRHNHILLLNDQLNFLFERETIFQ